MSDLSEAGGSLFTSSTLAEWLFGQLGSAPPCSAVAGTAGLQCCYSRLSPFTSAWLRVAACIGHSAGWVWWKKGTTRGVQGRTSCCLHLCLRSTVQHCASHLVSSCHSPAHLRVHYRAVCFKVGSSNCLPTLLDGANQLIVHSRGQHNCWRRFAPANNEIQEL